MNTPRFPILTAVALVGIIAAPPARAQPGNAVQLRVAQPPRQQRPFDDDDDAEPAVLVPAQPAIFIDDANFDQWIFGGDMHPERGRTKLQGMLNAQIEMVNRDYRLTEAQRRKLELAGRGDTKRFFDRVQVARTALDAVRTDRNRIGDFHQLTVLPLQRAYQVGIYGEGSFFAKSLAKTLDASQAAHYQASVRERNTFRARACLRLALASIDANIGLTADQRKRLWKLIEDEVRPPKRFSDYDYYVVIIQLARLPESKLTPIFTPSQRRLLGAQFDMARGREQLLVANGVMPDEPAKDVRNVP